MNIHKGFIVFALVSIMATTSHASILNEIPVDDCKAIQETSQQFMNIFNSDTAEHAKQSAKEFNQKWPDFVPRPTGKRPETYEFDFDGDGQNDKITVQNGLGTNMMAGAYKISSSKTGETKDSLEMPAQIVFYKNNYYLSFYNLTVHPQDPQRPFFEYLSLSKITSDGIIPVCLQSK